MMIQLAFRNAIVKTHLAMAICADRGAMICEDRIRE